MGENLVNHCLLGYTEHTTIKLSCAINHFNNNSIMNVQQSNLKFTNESSIITCENLINHCLLRYTEYHHSKFISPVNKSHLQLNSNHQSNWKEMQCASQSLSIQIQMLINVYVPKKLNRHRRCYNLNYEQKTKEIYSTIKCPNRLSTISNVSNMNYESSDYKLSPRLKWKKLLRLNYNRKLQTFNHALIP